MPRIVLVGAGSVEFTRNLLGDILSSPALRSSHIALHDIDPERLATAERMARWTAGALGAEPTISAHLDRREALDGADFVVNTIQVGGARATQVDFDVPARFGLRYTIADTIGVGGVFRGLRTIPVVLGIARDMEEICPNAVAPQLHEPAGDPRPGRLGGDRRSGSSGCATRSSGRSTGWPATSALPREEVDARIGRAQPPRLHPPARAPRPGPLPGAARLRRGGPDARRRPRPGRPVPPTRLLPDRVVRAPRRVQPVVHRQARCRRRRRRALPHPDRRVPRPRLAQPRRVRRDEADARRRRAVRDRAERRVRGHDRRGDDDRRRRPGSSSTR